MSKDKILIILTMILTTGILYITTTHNLFGYPVEVVP